MAAGTFEIYNEICMIASAYDCNKINITATEYARGSEFQRDTMAGNGTKVPTTIKRGYLKNNPVFDWQPVKCLEQWSNMLMSVFEKSKLRCIVWMILQPVHLITVDVIEQRVVKL